MKFASQRLRRNCKALSPAFSTMILTAAAIVMILVAMSYANNILNIKVAENEFDGNKQFMQTTGQQLDDIAWTIGRTQTIAYSNRFGTLKFEDAAIQYTINIHYNDSQTGIWTNQTVSYTTGIMLYNMPVSSYALNDGYFVRVPSTADGSILQLGASAPVCQVFCEEKLSMPNGSYARVVLAPTLRLLNSTTSGYSYLRLYVPNLQSDGNPYLSQTLTLTGDGISKVKQSSVDWIVITVSFPNAALGFDAQFFKFKATSVAINTSPMPGQYSTLEVYAGNVGVSIGAV